MWESRTATVPRRLLVILRVYLGTLFIYAGVTKLNDGQWPSELVGFLQGALQHGHPFYRGFISGVVLPHAAGFAAVIRMAELLTGVALVTGTATRLAALGAMFLTVNYMFAKGAWWWWASSNDSAFFFIALVLILGRAGRSFGVDYFLAQRWPDAWIW